MSQRVFYLPPGFEQAEAEIRAEAAAQEREACFEIAQANQDVEDIVAAIRARGEAPKCHSDGCTSTARHGPDGKPVACWSHAGDWPDCAPKPDAREPEELLTDALASGLPPPPTPRELALKALRELPLPSQETLAAVDDDDLSGSRPCHLRTTIAQVRSLHAAIAALEGKG